MTESLKSIITNIDRVCEAHPIMTVEEERELCFRLKDDRPMLEEKLVLHNIRFMQSVVSRYTDGIILIVKHGASRRKEVLAAVRALRFAKAHLLGTVYNGYTHSGYQYYHRYYNSDTKAESRN